jgi:cytochrome c2
MAPALLAVALLAGGTTRAQAQDAVAGERVFKTNCGICHSPKPGRNLVGPTLFSVVNRHSGEIPGFHYSDANKNSGLTWTVATLDRYIAAPQEIVPGTKSLTLNSSATSDASDQEHG